MATVASILEVDVTAVVSVTPNKGKEIDALLCGYKWKADSLTFSFPDSSAEYGKHYGKGQPADHFQALTPVQQAAVESILDMYSSICNLNFTEITETATQHATLRLAESDQPDTSFGYYPASGATGGDVWVNRSSGAYDDPVPANYAWLTLIHELGHTMGLKHPHQVIGHFGKMPAAYDSTEYTVMSYRSYAGASLASYTNDPTSFPQTLMMYDIAALQALYGANYNTNSGDTVYQWDPNSGEMFINGVGQGAPAGNKIFMTIWDGGGNDTYDFSNYTTGVSVNLQPGQWSTTSTVQLAVLGPDHLAVGNIANALLHHGNTASLIEDAIGGSGNDTIIGNAADNTLTGGGGNDTLDGAAGINTAAYAGPALDYSWSLSADGSWTVVDNRADSPDGTDTLTNIQYLQFSDVKDLLVPIAADDSFVTHERSVTIDVLANDLAPDGATLSAVVVKGPAHGKLVLADDGEFIYTAPKHFKGTVKFTYIATDGSSDSEVATVRIKVGAPAAKSNAAHEKVATSFETVKVHDAGNTHSVTLEDHDKGNMLDIGQLYEQSYAQGDVLQDGHGGSVSLDTLHHDELGYLFR